MAKAWLISESDIVPDDTYKFVREGDKIAIEPAPKDIMEVRYWQHKLIAKEMFGDKLTVNKKTGEPILDDAGLMVRRLEPPSIEIYDQSFTCEYRNGQNSRYRMVTGEIVQRITGINTICRG